MFVNAYFSFCDRETVFALFFFQPLDKKTWWWYNDTKKTWQEVLCMKKEEILESSRKEHKNRDLAELEADRYAGSLAGKVGATVCCVISLLSSLIAHMMLYSPWMIYFSIMGTTWLVRAIKLKKKSDWICAVIFFILTILALIGLLHRLLEAAV